MTNLVTEALSPLNLPLSLSRAQIQASLSAAAFSPNFGTRNFGGW
jgi:hypothetical protein